MHLPTYKGEGTLVVSDVVLSDPDRQAYAITPWLARRDGHTELRAKNRSGGIHPESSSTFDLSSL
jgi:hypothetical protein